MRPVFVFDCLNVVGKDEITLETAKVALERTNEAWTLYGDNSPAAAVNAFGASGMISLPNFRPFAYVLQAQSELKSYIEFCKKFSSREI
jgi:hypothetical protein